MRFLEKQAMQVRLGVMALVLLASACSGGGGGVRDYPADVRQNFISACTTGGGSTQQCSCVLEKIEDEYTLEEFTELERALDAGQRTTELNGITEDCT